MNVLLLCLAHLVLSQSQKVQLPTDVSSYARGVDAVGFDPAAAGVAEGFELQWRSHWRATGDAYGAYTTLPFPYLKIFSGYDYLGGTTEQQRFSLGVSAPLGGGWHFGVAYRQYWLDASLGKNSAAIFDASLLGEVTPWLSLNIGIEAFDQAKLYAEGVANPFLKRNVRLGAAVRPVKGATWLTLAGDVQLADSIKDITLLKSRALIDVMPLLGLHVLAAYEHVPDEDTAWLGMSFSFGLLNGRILSGYATRSENSDTTLSTTFRANPPASLRDNSPRTIEMTLSGELLTMNENTFWPSKKVISLTPLYLENLSKDKTVETVILKIEKMNVGLATVYELQQAIQTLRQAHKKVIAEIIYGDDKTYMVAAMADVVNMDPLGHLNIDGFAARKHYFAETLEKIGVRFESVEIGQYKSGPDFLTRSQSREQEKPTQNAILEQALLGLKEVLQTQRKLPENKVTAILEQASFNAEKAKQFGLIDGLTQPEHLAEHMPHKRPEGLHYDDIQKPSGIWGQKPEIAVVPVKGTIVMHKKDNPLPGITCEAEAVVEHLENVSHDTNVKAIILRIESPGGDVYASELIWRAVKRARAYKPVIASMGDMAASGGYYVASAASTIFAEPDTITGSIGIFALRLNLQKLYSMLDIHAEVFKQGPYADWEFEHQPLSEGARERLRASLKGYYDEFVERVAVGRKLPKERVYQIAEGQVYTGKKALELKLVDTLGGLTKAIAYAREVTKIPLDREIIVSVPSQAFSLWEMREAMMQAKSFDVKTLWHDHLEQLTNLQERAFAILPETYALDE